MSEKIILNKFAERFTYLVKKNDTDISEILEKIGLKSRATIYRYMNGTMAPKIPTIKFLSELYSVNPLWLMGYDVPMDVKLDNRVNLAPIPILGLIKAGFDYLSTENIVGYIRDFAVSDPENYYAVYARDDSMQPVLSNGDIAIVHKQSNFESGNTCVILIGDEMTIKKVVKTDDGIDLIPANPYYDVQHFTKKEIKSLSINIIGRVLESRIRSAFK